MDRFDDLTSLVASLSAVDLLDTSTVVDPTVLLWLGGFSACFTIAVIVAKIKQCVVVLEVDAPRKIPNRG